MQEITTEFFKYDEDLPLEAVETEHGVDSQGNRQCHITFRSTHDQRVPALLTLPSQVNAPFPVVLILHGVLGHKESYNQQKRSAYLASAGYATLRIDGQYRGEREVNFGGEFGLQNHYYYRNRDAMVQTAVDLMRAVDFLTTRDDIDAGRMGFAGFSMGGAIGTLFCANDRRVEAVVLGITGGDFRRLRIGTSDERSEARMRQAYQIVDPILYVHQISPRPLLMLNAAHDEVVPRAATEALFNAAREPKRIVWYDCGHTDLPDEMLAEMTRFFDSVLA